MLQGEKQLHTEEWNRAVEALRRSLGIAGPDRQRIATQLARRSHDDCARTCHAAYRRLVRQAGTHERYGAYFAACALTHWGENDAEHALPAWLGERLGRLASNEPPLPPATLRIRFAHREYAQPGGIVPGPEPAEVPVHNLLDDRVSSEWRPAGFPYALEVLWPYEVPMLATDRETLAAVKRDLRENGVNMAWYINARFVALHDDGWLLLPLRVVKGLAEPTTLQRIYGLPDSTVLAVLPVPMPVLIDGSGAVHLYELDTSPPLGHVRQPLGFRSLGSIRPFQPKVVRDGSMPSQEKPFADLWERLVARVAVHPQLRGGRGAPRKRARAPGFTVYSRLVGQLYAAKLREWGERQLRLLAELGQPANQVRDPTAQERRSIWEGARREARRQIKPEHRDPIPAGLRAAVEALSPWRKGVPSA